MDHDQRTGRRVDLVEARRRADILRRYVAIDLPTSEVDRRFAAEIGLTVDTLVRLATAWRLHRDERLLAAPRLAMAAGSAPSHAAVMAEKLDMEGVDPDRRKSMMRRIRIIQAHLRARERRSADADTSAAKLGVSRERFEDLVRQWRLHASPRAMPGARRGVRTPRRNPEPRRRTLEILRTLLAEHPDEAIARIHERLAAACLEAGLRPPSRPQTYRLAREVRYTPLNDAIRSR